MQVKVDPLGKFRAEMLLRDTNSTDSSRLAGRGEFRERERIDAFRVNNLSKSSCFSNSSIAGDQNSVAAHLVIFLDSSETTSDSETKENIGSESVDVHVAVGRGTISLSSQTVSRARAAYRHIETS